MANKRITDLSSLGVYDADVYLEVDKGTFPEAQNMKASVFILSEETARKAQDDVIEAGAGLTVLGAYVPDDTTNYLRAADFAAAVVTPCLKEADNLLDTELAALAATVLGAGNMVKTTITVDSTRINGLKASPFNLLGHPIADTEFTGYRIKIIDAWARLDYSPDPINVSAADLVLRYSDGTQIGTWTGAFYQSAADATQTIDLDTNISVGEDCVQLYCANNSTDPSTSDLYISLVYILEAV